MFIDKAAAIVAMVFAAVILAHPGPAIAQADVDKAMGVLPSPPGASKGIVIVDGKQMSYEDAKKMGVDPSGAESKGIVIIDGKPMSLGDAAAKGIIIIGLKPGGLPSPGASKGIIIGNKPGGPGGNKVGMEMCCDPDDERSAKMGIALPGATKGIVVIDTKPGGIAAKGLSPPNTLGGAASKGIIIGNKPVSPGKLPAGKGMMIKGK